MFHVQHEAKHLLKSVYILKSAVIIYTLFDCLFHVSSYPLTKKFCLTYVDGFEDLDC